MIDTTTSPRRSGVVSALRCAALPLALLAILAACAGRAPPGAAGPAAATNVAGSKLVAQTSPEIHRIEALGRTLYTLDIAAARATDIAFAEGADLRAPDMRGRVTDISGSSVLVRFVRQRDGRFEAAYDVTFVGDGQAPVLTRPADPTLTPDQSAQLAAGQLAAASLVPLCKLPYTPVVFRDPDTRDWRVYLLAASADPQVRVYAGHQRFLVSGDGSRILSSGPLSQNCLAPRLEAPAGHTPEAFLMTESLSPTPTEAHVFASLLYGLPILVVTAADKRHWIVDQGRIWGAT
ncbi:hypothetical protein [Inquilinus sp. CA228]|uniref:hypothetical protein n=1 Tax=Inquilinus sp. CA228 TaxID=3455609 RepID=UPI003F8D408C